MTQGKLIAIGSRGEGNNWYQIQLAEDIHGIFINLFNELGMENAIEAHLSFSNIPESYHRIVNKDFLVQFFIEEDYIIMVIDTDMERGALNEVVQKYFSFEPSNNPETP